MITVVFGDGFLKSISRIPATQQEKLAKLLSTLQVNPYDPKLHTKHLDGALTGMLSFRISRDWRVLFHFRDARTIQLLRTDHRKDIYR